MATMTIKNAAGGDEVVEKPLAPNRAPALTSRPIVLSEEDFAVIQQFVTALGEGDTPKNINPDADGNITANLKGILEASNSTAATLTAFGNDTTAYANQGDVAHDAVDAGNPVKIGARSISAETTAVVAGRRVNLVTDLASKLIILPYANPENFVWGVISAAMTGTTPNLLLAAPGAGLRNYITSVIVSNSHATVGTDVVLQDGSGGTILGVFPAAPAYGGAALPLPVPIRQPTTNLGIFAANVTTGSSIKVTAYGYKGV